MIHFLPLIFGNLGSGEFFWSKQKKFSTSCSADGWNLPCFQVFTKKAQSSNQMLDQLSPMRRWTFQVELPFWQRNKIIIEAETASITTNMSRLEKNFFWAQTDVLLSVREMADASTNYLPTSTTWRRHHRVQCAPKIVGLFGLKRCIE